MRSSEKSIRLPHRTAVDLVLGGCPFRQRVQGEVQLEYREFDAGHFKNYTKTVSLEGGQLKMIEKNRMNYVMNVDGGETK